MSYCTYDVNLGKEILDFTATTKYSETKIEIAYEQMAIEI